MPRDLHRLPSRDRRDVLTAALCGAAILAFFGFFIGLALGSGIPDTKENAAVVIGTVFAGVAGVVGFGVGAIIGLNRRSRGD